MKYPTQAQPEPHIRLRIILSPREILNYRLLIIAYRLFILTYSLFIQVLRLFIYRVMAVYEILKYSPVY